MFGINQIASRQAYSQIDNCAAISPLEPAAILIFYPCFVSRIVSLKKKKARMMGLLVSKAANGVPTRVLWTVLAILISSYVHPSFVPCTAFYQPFELLGLLSTPQPKVQSWLL